jgi:hypothetical protein
MAYNIYPTPTVKRFFKACRQDELFLSQHKEIEGDEYIHPHRFSDNVVIVLYASVYAGWLLGRGETKKYKELDNGH